MTRFLSKSLSDFLFPTEPISKSLSDCSIISSSADVISSLFFAMGVAVWGLQIAYPGFSLPHTFCDFGPSASSPGDVCENFFPVDVLGSGTILCLPLPEAYAFLYRWIMN